MILFYTVHICSSSESESDTDNELLDTSVLDDEILLCEEENVCTCESLKAHKIDCPMNTRNLYGKRLFSQTATFKPGDKVTVHIPEPRMAKTHLVCRVVQVNDGRYTLHYKRGLVWRDSQAVHFDTAESTDTAFLLTSGDRAPSSS